MPIDEEAKMPIDREANDQNLNLSKLGPLRSHWVNVPEAHLEIEANVIFADINTFMKSNQSGKLLYIIKKNKSNSRYLTFLFIYEFLQKNIKDSIAICPDIKNYTIIIKHKLNP